MRQVVNALRARVVSSGVPSTEGGVNIVAFSGGVDSSLVAALVHEAFPRNSLACVGVSAALPEAQLQLARRVAYHIGVPLSEVITGEGSNPQYIANEGQSCFYCKTHLYSALEAVAERAGKESLRPTPDAVGNDGRTAERGDRRRVVLFNGTNKEDRSDPTRVGLKAAAEFQVASPIDGLSKDEVRAVSLELGLPNWNHAASPCLRSRLAFGVQATPERLVQVEKAEDVARRYLGLNVSHNLRVRAMHGEKALLEVDDGEVLEKAVQALPDLHRLILPLGFGELNVRAFRSGGLSGASLSAAPASQGRAAADGAPKTVTDGVEMSHVVSGGRSGGSHGGRGEVPSHVAS